MNERIERNSHISLNVFFDLWKLERIEWMNVLNAIVTARSSFFDLSELELIEWMNGLNFCEVAQFFFWIVIQFVNDIFS